MSEIGPLLDGSLFGPGQPCFGCGPDHPHGLRLTFAREGDEVVNRFVPGPHHQGPPGIMHGGLISTLADELAAWTVIVLLGKFGFTASFDAELLRPIRMGVPLEGRGRIVHDRRRVITVGVRLVQAGAEAYRATLRFVLLDRAGAEKMLQGPIPEQWLKYCR